MTEVIKDRPLNYKRILQRTAITIGLAILFGLVASVVFLSLQPVMSKWLTKTEEPEHVTETQVTLDMTEEVEPEDEVLPEDMIQHDTGLVIDPEDPENEGEDLTGETEEEPAEETEPQIVYIYEDVSMNIEDYKGFYGQLGDLAATVMTCLVEVTGSKSDVNWFQDIYQSGTTSTGLILNTLQVDEEQYEYLILVQEDTIHNKDHIYVTFCDGSVVPGTLKASEDTTGMAVVSVSSADVSDESAAMLTVAAFASNPGDIGDPVLAVGSPLGSNTMSFGMLTGNSDKIYLADLNMTLLTTGIYSTKSPSGVLVDMDGKIIGLLTNSYNSSDTSNLLSALSVRELRNRITALMNGRDIPYTGTYVMDVPQNIREEQKIPTGVYVSKVDMNSPAMQAGLQSGDIISAIDGSPVTTASAFVSNVFASEINAVRTFTVDRLTTSGYKTMELTVTIGKEK